MLRFSWLLAALISTTSLAGTSGQTAKSLKSRANKLSEFLSNGRAKSVSVTSGKLNDMVKEYFSVVYQSDEEPNFVSNAESFNSDESEVGIFKSRAIAFEKASFEMSYCSENELADNEDTDIDENLTFNDDADELLSDLGQKGVYFGYDANGQGWGGMPITILLAIDTNKKEVHAITMQCNAYHD